MIKFFNKKYLSLVLIGFFVFGIFSFAPKKAAAACTVNSFHVRPNGVQPTQIGDPDPVTVNDFPGPNNPYRNSSNGYPVSGYSDSSSGNAIAPPYVYFDVQTSGCIGSTLLLAGATAQAQQQLSNSINQTPWNAVFGSNSTYYAFSPIPLIVGGTNPQTAQYNTDGDNFTVVYRAGETTCQSQVGNNCKYLFVLASPNPITIHQLGDQNLPALAYECYGNIVGIPNCGDSWQFVDIINYGQNVLEDTVGTDVGVLTNNSVFTPGYDYPLAPLPGVNPNTTSTLGGFLKALFTVLIVIAGILAFIMIVIGGVTYATSDAFSDKSAGKEMILNAILGLIIALGSWIILNTINPNLASNLSITIPKATLDIPRQEWQNGNATPGTNIAHGITLNGQPITQGMPWPDDSAQRNQLSAAGISVTSSANSNCTPTAGTPGCTSVYFEGDAASVIGQIIAFKTQCGCDIVITGGSEAWLHQTHGPNVKVVDMRATDSLNTYLNTQNGASGNSFPSNKWITINGVGRFWAESSNGSANATEHHWHVIFN